MEPSPLRTTALDHRRRERLLVLATLPQLGPCICGCERLADTYPYGLAQAPLAEHHYAEYLNPPAHIHPEYDTIAQATLPPQTYSELRAYMPSEAARAYPGAYYQLPSVGPAPDNVSPCVLCGTAVTAWTIG